MLPDNLRNKDNMKKYVHEFQWFSAGLCLLCLLGLTGIAAGAQGGGGRITGQIVDTETGEFLLGATIQLQDSNMGTYCDLDGTYTLSNVPAGSYDMVVYLMGYSKTIIQSVTVSNSEVTKLDVSLKPEPIMGREVVVRARAIENTEAALLKKRQRSNSVSDAISAEGLSRAGSGNAADAVGKVTGASVVGGQYVYIRGLGERYSSAHLNGTELPSADPDKKAFQMDILPSNLLENITVIKSFTPDQPGNFSGGIIDVGTKSYPENLTFKFSTSAAYNNHSSLNSDYMTYDGGDWDWLGFDDGARYIPDELKNADIPDIGGAFSDPDKAYSLDELSESFNSIMSPIRKSPPLDQSYSLAVGNMVDFEDNRQLGYLVSFNYNRKHRFYDEGEVGRWRLAGNIDEAQSLGKDFYLSDTKGSDEVLWGGLFTGSYKPNLNHEFGINYIHTQSGESIARYLTGKFYDGNLPEDAIYETRVLKYTERTLNSFQLNGEHQLNSIFGIRANWKATYTNNTQDEPDLRFFSNHYTVTEDDTFFTIRPSHYTVPQRYFRNLEEDNLGFDLKLALPFDQWSGLSSKLSLGSYYSIKSRKFRERVFEYQNQDVNAYDGDPYDFFSDENCGII
ncbi:MAG: TonB-dependent receptor plug domain-containing protein, partial [candidate division Zixibacteria bacterium]|nr:TonB-dependent receptor plug domain-containing protein [candidate division Zixibacteria bacterium]